MKSICLTEQQSIDCFNYDCSYKLIDDAISTRSSIKDIDEIKDIQKLRDELKKEKSNNLILIDQLQKLDVEKNNFRAECGKKQIEIEKLEKDLKKKYDRISELEDDFKNFEMSIKDLLKKFNIDYQKQMLNVQLS